MSSSLSSSAATTAVRSLDGLSGLWDIDAEASSVEFRARHFFLLPVSGRIPVSAGAVQLDAGGALRAFDISLTAADFNTGSPGRDRQVTGAGFLDAERHPVLRFTGDRLNGGATAGWTVEGRLTVKGNSVPLTLYVDPAGIETEDSGTRAVVRATAEVDRHALGVSAMRGMVGPRLRVCVTAVFVRGL
ncbi:YceI family protein [Streptomyces sp. NPDC059957]|uniref:YceI family protein n=1 Tax=unclassified Streptomyces TaxID=2593676 RepID=UPI003659E44F